MVSPWNDLIPWLTGPRWTNDEDQVSRLGFKVKALQCSGFQDIQIFGDNKMKTINFNIVKKAAHLNLSFELFHASIWHDWT